MEDTQPTKGYPNSCIPTIDIEKQPCGFQPINDGGTHGLYGPDVAVQSFIKWMKRMQILPHSTMYGAVCAMRVYVADSLENPNTSNAVKLRIMSLAGRILEDTMAGQTSACTIYETLLTLSEWL